MHLIVVLISTAIDHMISVCIFEFFPNFSFNLLTLLHLSLTLASCMQVMPFDGQLSHIPRNHQYNHITSSLGRKIMKTLYAFLMCSAHTNKYLRLLLMRNGCIPALLQQYLVNQGCVIYQVEARNLISNICHFFARDIGLQEA